MPAGEKSKDSTMPGTCHILKAVDEYLYLEGQCFHKLPNCLLDVEICLKTNISSPTHHISVINHMPLRTPQLLALHLIWSRSALLSGGRTNFSLLQALNRTHLTLFYLPSLHYPQRRLHTSIKPK